MYFSELILFLRNLLHVSKKRVRLLEDDCTYNYGIGLKNLMFIGPCIIVIVEE